jgi:hypothetical protein
MGVRHQMRLVGPQISAQVDAAPPAWLSQRRKRQKAHPLLLLLLLGALIGIVKRP